MELSRLCLLTFLANFTALGLLGLICSNDTEMPISKRRRREPNAGQSNRVAKPRQQKLRRPLRQSTPKLLNRPPIIRLQIFVFGEGSAGELGLGGGKSAIDVATPRLNHNLDPEKVGVVDLATGGMHTVALTSNNTVLTWGVNDLGALGRDTTWDGGMRDIDKGSDSDSDDSDPGMNPFESTPMAVPDEKFRGARIVQVAAGDSSSFVLTDDGRVYGWGTFRVGSSPELDYLC